MIHQLTHGLSLVPNGSMITPPPRRMRISLSLWKSTASRATRRQYTRPGAKTWFRAASPVNFSGRLALTFPMVTRLTMDMPSILVRQPSFGEKITQLELTQILSSNRFRCVPNSRSYCCRYQGSGLDSRTKPNHCVSIKCIHDTISVPHLLIPRYSLWVARMKTQAEVVFVPGFRLPARDSQGYGIVCMGGPPRCACQN